MNKLTILKTSNKDDMQAAIKILSNGFLRLGIAAKDAALNFQNASKRLSLTN